MNKLCDCYETEEVVIGYDMIDRPIKRTVSKCYGTPEREECDCKGDVSNCTFYPEKRLQGCDLSDREREELFFYRNFILKHDLLYLCNKEYLEYKKAGSK